MVGLVLKWGIFFGGVLPLSKGPLISAFVCVCIALSGLSAINSA